MAPRSCSAATTTCTRDSLRRRRPASRTPESGIRQFVVGTGGRSHYAFGRHRAEQPGTRGEQLRRDPPEPARRRLRLGVRARGRRGPSPTAARRPATEPAASVARRTSPSPSSRVVDQLVRHGVLRPQPFHLLHPRPEGARGPASLAAGHERVVGSVRQRVSGPTTFGRCFSQVSGIARSSATASPTNARWSPCMIAGVHAQGSSRPSSVAWKSVRASTNARSPSSAPGLVSA